MVYGYQDARDFFGAVRQAAVEVERYERRVQRMESAEGVRAQGYQPGSRSARNDAMAKTDARIDYEERMRPRMERDYLLIDLACRICYGEDAKKGVAELLGPEYADVLWWYYCCGWSWSRTAGVLKSSATTVRRWRDVAMDTVDGMGVRRALAGEGIAEG